MCAAEDDCWHDPLATEPFRLFNACPRHLHLSAANNNTVALQVLHDSVSMDAVLMGKLECRHADLVLLNKPSPLH